jgi:hypothetical protein
VEGPRGPAPALTIPFRDALANGLQS